jgi:ketosteroid isomerase-like protein
MSQENVEIVHRMADAFNRSGIEAALPYIDPQIEWYGPPGWLEQHVYTGHEGIRQLAATWSDNFDGLRLDVERVIDVDDDEVLVLVYQRGRIKDSGVPIELRVGYEWQLRKGKTVRVQAHFSWEEALEAVGLSGQDAHADS